MRRLLCSIVLVVGCGVFGGERLNAQEALATAADAARAPGDSMGFVIRPDGVAVGRVATVDPTTFNLIPAPNASVMFLQSRRIVGQGRTGEDGSFAVPGLSPWGLYSVVVQSGGSVAAYSVAIRPEGQAAQAVDQTLPRDVKAARGSAFNEIRLVSKLAANSATMQPAGVNVIPMQMIPVGDLLMALGLDGGGFGAPAPAGGFGGGGGGGGGGGAGGLGALAGLAGLAAVGGGTDGRGIATQFAPPAP